MADSSRTVIALGLLAGAAYFFWKSIQRSDRQYRSQREEGTGGQPSDRGSPSPASSQPPPASWVASVPDLSDDVADRIRAIAPEDSYTADEWGWYYAQVTGRPAPPPEDYGFSGAGRFRKLSFQEWWSALKSRFSQAATVHSEQEEVTGEGNAGMHGYRTGVIVWEV